MRFPALIVVCAAVSACEPARDRATERLTATGELVALSGGGGGARNACFTCHGLEGAGDGAASPRLAGLEVGYLHKQMEDYASGLRRHPVMTPVAQALDAESRRSVSQWYAAMPPPRSPPGAAPPAPAIYRLGDRSRNIAPCADCHGANGQGVGEAAPAITGQPAAYTVDQLRRWRSGERRGDPLGVMRQAAAGLSEPEMQALAVWLSAAPTAPPPDSVSASATAATSASR